MPFSARLRGRRYFGADLAVVATVALLTVVLAVLDSGNGDAAPTPTARATVPGAATFAKTGATVQPGFLGLSLEYPSIERYVGTDPRSLNPVFLRLVRALTPGQRPVLRIGGDSTDNTWYPVSGLTPPGGIRFTLSQRWFRVAKALTSALGARLILGINFEADSSELAAAEAQALVNNLGLGSVRALELGNEPELYSTFPWYRTADKQKVTGRSLSYDFTAFTNDFAAVASSLPQVPLAGPAAGGTAWSDRLAEFLTAVPRVALVTLHKYPTQLCFTATKSLQYPSIAHLLAPAASTGLAEGLAPYARTAHARGKPLRIDEFNSVSCGADRKVSQTFASALWAVDALFELARVGIDGVNVHTFPNAGYELFSVQHAAAGWRATVSPEYYGLRLFAQAAPAGSRLIRAASLRGGRVKLWATRAQSGQIRVTVINKGTAPITGLGVTIPGATGAATLTRLQAPSLTATSGVTLGGQSFAVPTSTGELAGNRSTDTVKPSHGQYVIPLPAASAALLTLPSANS
ncbi:MAG TPA: glycosyl hydrolase family 79 C-terminal domain-containing protein [Solirubrobacteraceae bacterium]